VNESGSGARLRATLDDHQTIDAREARAKATLLSELQGLSRPFDEEADPTHVTASGIIVSERGVVLHRHRILGRWLQPGGHIEPGEAPEDAVLRECLEETGLAVSHPSGGPVLLHVDVHQAARGHTHLDVRYLLSSPPDDPAPGPGESQEVGWFAWDTAASMADDALRGALRAARRLTPHA
jgi:8-oxo-dGTP pyrophosphatase MutT (NUDIX family)